MNISKHGRLKVRTTEEQKALKAQENAKKLAAYRAAMESILMKVCMLRMMKNMQ